MEKVLYVLWRDPTTPLDAWADGLRTDLGPALIAAGAHGVQVNVADDAVAAASAMRIVTTDPQMEAVVGVWVDTVVADRRRPLDDLVAAASSRFVAYLVAESQPLPNTEHPPRPGERTAGYAQVAFLHRPATMTPDEWLDVWQNGHTSVAIDTQSTFQYVQNEVIRALTPDAPPWGGIVEECFPTEAMGDLHVFFDAVGDDERLVANMTAMGESTGRFLETDRLDVVPTSQYVIAPNAN